MKKKHVKRIKKNMNIKYNTSIFILICVLLSIFSIGLEVNKSNSTKKQVNASSSTCTIDGKTSGSYNFTFKATERTSGVNYWECRNRSSGTWTQCANSSECYTYKINADSGYDQIRNYDNAGNVSEISYLYKKDRVTIEGVQSYSSVSKSNYGIGEVKIIIGSSATQGSISTVSINNNNKIAVTGTGDSCSIRKYFSATRDRKKVCSAGTYNSSSGKCEAESYRLQNDTCWCAMQDDGTGHLEVVWDNSPGVCGRRETYCIDTFKSSDNDKDKYTKATNRVKDSKVGETCVGSPNEWGNSCNFTRPTNSEKYTYYPDITKVIDVDITNYNDYSSYIIKYNDYARTDTVIKKLADFSTDDVPSSSYVSGNTMSAACKALEAKGLSTSVGIKTAYGSETIYVVPMIGSAPCNFNSKAPDETNPIYSSTSYYKKDDSSNSDYFYYCDKNFYNGITYDNGEYKCYKDVENYCYSYTVDYYYKN